MQLVGLGSIGNDEALRRYDLRRTHASLLTHESVHPRKISARLGHSSIKLAMDAYGHLFDGSDRDSAETMERPFGEEPKRPRAPTVPGGNRRADKNSKARWERAAKRLIMLWSHPPGLNRRPADYESAALPTELGWLALLILTTCSESRNSTSIPSGSLPECLAGECAVGGHAALRLLVKARWSISAPFDF